MFFRITLACCAVWCAQFSLLAQNIAPQIESFQVTADWNSQKLHISYSVVDPDDAELEVAVQFSIDQGKNYDAGSALPLSGDIGFPVSPGNNKTIEVDLASWNNPPGTIISVRLVVDDRQPVDIHELVAQVDSNRLRSNLEFVQGIRHRGSGPLHLQAVRDSLTSLFTGLDLFAGQHTFTYTNYTGRNILGIQAGTTAAEQVVIVDAHYDSVFNAPGADDNGSGVVGVMEAARILSQYPSQRTFRFIGFDLEESGLVGSTRYANDAAAAGDSILAVLNFEMIGYYSDVPNSQTLPNGFNLLFPDAFNAVANNGFKGDFITNVGNVNSSALVDQFANAAAQYVPGLRVISLKVPGNGEIAPDLRRSDHTPFWVAGYPALMLTDGANFRNQAYHTAGDTLEDRLNFTFMRQVVQATLATAAELAMIQHGDWATASFEQAVSTHHSPVNCQLKAHIRSGGSSRLFFESADCLPEIVDLELYDLTGRRFWSGTVQKGAAEILLPDLPSGVYCLRAQFPGGAFVQKTFVP